MNEEEIERTLQAAAYRARLFERGERRTAARAELAAVRAELDALTGIPPIVDDERARSSHRRARRLAVARYGAACEAYMREFQEELEAEEK